MPPKPVPKRQLVGAESKVPAGRGGAVSKGPPGRGGVTAAVGKKTLSSGVNRQLGGIVPPIKKGVQLQKSQGVKSGPTAKTVSKPVKPVWTKEDDMARKIQSCFRGYRCRKLLLTLRQKKEQYEQMMDRLEKEAFLHMVRMEQDKAAKEREREENERRKRREEAKRVKRFLEAAFDGDNSEIESILGEVAKLHSSSGEGIVARFQYKLVECSDANNNTPLSEAAAGGHADTINLLVTKGAQLNTKGQYGRTPLYRAAFGGHTDAVKALLEHGGDPRLYADDGALPEHVASGKEIEQILIEWNIEKTEELLKKLEDETRKRKEIEQILWKNEEDQLQAEIKAAEKENSAKQKELTNAHEELNKRMYEHDKCVLKNMKPELTLKSVQDAEDHLERCKLHAEESRKKLQEAKLKMRMKRKEYVTESDEEEDDTKVDVVVTVRELDDVLMKDVGDKITQSGKWPLIIDPGKQCSTFLRYRDTNYLSAVNPRDMDMETIRMGLLGAIRYGKFLVLDLLDIEEMWPAVVAKFDLVQRDLLPAIMTKDFLKEKRYLKLTKKSDGEEYSDSMFMCSRVENFKLVIITQLPIPPVEILEQTYIIKIHVPEPFGL